MEFKNYTVKYYTDGACKGNPGPGGYGLAVFYNDKFQYKACKYYGNTTNNRMELKAIIFALKDIQINYPSLNCVIYTDSSYCYNMLKFWIYKWAQRDWHNEKGEEVKNIDLVKQAFELIRTMPNVDIEKVKGHDGDIRNELADAIATYNEKKYYEIFTSEKFEVFL